MLSAATLALPNMTLTNALTFSLTSQRKDLVFGYDLYQPTGDLASLAAMNRKIAGSECEFLLPKSKLQLRSTGFGSSAARCRKANLHSHLGKGFALDWAIHKNCAKLWGVRFTALTDCFALRFILTYTRTNPALLIPLMVEWYTFILGVRGARV